MNIPELGIGIIYFSGFENILESNSDLIQVVEIEPQTFWYKNNPELDSFVFDKEKIQYLKSIDLPKLFHGVGFPVGGSIPFDRGHVPYMKKMMEELNPVWLSEHLSFNTIKIDEELCNTNFLLPPLQTTNGIEVATRAIKNYSSNFDLPFAFETGVNYLSKKEFEIEDGQFVNEVAKASDCKILLDLHNLLANQKNGRQDVFDFVNQLDLERVIQIHLAGGFYFKGYYLDAHSNVSSMEVLDIFEKVVRLLPNLKAITFEMLPEYLPSVSDKDMRMQLEKMNAIWDQRGRAREIKKDLTVSTLKQTAETPSVEEWENTLGLLAIGRNIKPEHSLVQILKNDPGLDIIKALIEKFRSSFIVSSMKLTSRYIMLHYGMRNFESLLRNFWSKSNPKLFASDNGIDFSQYLLEDCKLVEDNEMLRDLISYEYNSLRTIMDNKEREIQISFHPMEVVPSLINGELPSGYKTGNYIVTIEPDEFEGESIKSVFHS